MTIEPILDYVVTPHAAFEMRRRGLTEDVVRRVLMDPGQRLEVRAGRVVLQARMYLEQPEREWLVRVFVDVDRRPAEVVTAYRTSKIEKYWRR